MKNHSSSSGAFWISGSNSNEAGSLKSVYKSGLGASASLSSSS
jgi:hypothetical protein